MSYSKSDIAFDDIREVFDRAMMAPKGLRIVCMNRSAAIVTRSRFNYFRKIDRQINAKTYDPEHPLFGRSSYDKLVLRVPAHGHPEAHVLFIQPRTMEDLRIEEIE